MSLKYKAHNYLLSRHDPPDSKRYPGFVPGQQINSRYFDGPMDPFNISYCRIILESAIDCHEDFENYTIYSRLMDVANALESIINNSSFLEMHSDFRFKTFSISDTILLDCYLVWGQLADLDKALKYSWNFSLKRQVSCSFATWTNLIDLLH